MTDDHFERLILAPSLQSSNDAQVRTRILQRTEQDHNVNLQSITAKCQHLINLKEDSTMLVENTRPQDVYAVRPSDPTGLSI